MQLPTLRYLRVLIIKSLSSNHDRLDTNGQEQRATLLCIDKMNVIEDYECISSFAKFRVVFQDFLLHYSVLTVAKALD
jgi:hypothetical protein